MPSIDHLLRPDIAALEPYTPIVPLEVLAERLGLPAERIVKLDANENPFGPSPRAMAAMASYQHYAIYPDPEHTQLRAAISRYVGQPSERIICGAGSDEIIDVLMRAFLMPGDTIINCPPTFGMYAFDAGLYAAGVINVPRTDAFELDLEGVAEAAERSGAKMLFVAAPNNPTGTPVALAEVERLLDLPLLVVVDEAYAEFAGASAVAMVGQHPNLVVLRTFSKWAGLAGLRVGYAVVPEALIAHLWKIKQPYNVNVAAQVAALASLDDLDYLNDNVARLVAERGRLFGALSELPWLHVYPSQANFLLCRVTGVRGQGSAVGGRGSAETGDGGDAQAPGHKPQASPGAQRALELKQHLERQGILVRYYRTPALSDCIRISVGTPAQNNALLAALSEWS